MRHRRLQRSAPPGLAKKANVSRGNCTLGTCSSVRELLPKLPNFSVLKAVRTSAEKIFALQRRYAMVLHTDQAHPSFHVVVKAMSEEGERLNIRKAT